MTSWKMEDLEAWDDRIQEKVAEFGLNCYPQEFEVCDQGAMLGYMAYHGMPSHYPHWSFGKAYEQTKTMYDYGVTGLPYEMVINSDPCLAYLMRDNSQCLQVLTMAHVYGHNDFFKNNFTFTSGTDASATLSSFKTRADRIRGYAEDPSIGEDEVERFLDAAHALSFNCNRNAAFVQQKPAEQRQRLIDAATPPYDPFHRLHKRVEAGVPDLKRVPLEPEIDILRFIRDNNHHLAGWQRDVLTIVDEEARYFIPQIETKIMNEGWASYWHHKIMNSLGLPQDIHLEFLVRHNQVICPHPGGINPYYVGFVIFRYLESGVDGVLAGSYLVTDGTGASRRMSEREREFFARLAKNVSSGLEFIFRVRETDRDVAFLRRFLTQGLGEELDLFTWKPRGEHLVVDHISDDDGWDVVKGALLRQVGMGGFPTIKIKDAAYQGSRTMCLVHDHDGRDLDMGNAEKTLEHLATLWGHDVILETVLHKKPTIMSLKDGKFNAKLVS